MSAEDHSTPERCTVSLSYDNNACGDPECCGDRDEWEYQCEWPAGHDLMHKHKLYTSSGYRWIYWVDEDAK